MLPAMYRAVAVSSSSAMVSLLVCNTLALSPIRDTLIEGFSHFVTSMTAPIASGWSGCRVGLAPTGKRRLCTAHANNGHQRQRNFFLLAVDGARAREAPVRRTGASIDCYCALNALPSGVLTIGGGFHLPVSASDLGLYSR